ncbi:MAG: AAA family ATPase [Caulobacteraceae bacterium]
MLIVFSGLPGVGKSTIALALAAELRAVWLRIDTIEVAISDARLEMDIADAGYRVAYAVAADNLRLGLSVVGDSVNPLASSRAAWRQAARDAGVPCLDVEVICSNSAEHRRRVETRAPNIAGLVGPTWGEVVEREYHPWDGDRLVIDTARQDTATAVASIRSALARRQTSNGLKETSDARGLDEG